MIRRCRRLPGSMSESLSRLVSKSTFAIDCNCLFSTSTTSTHKEFQGPERDASWILPLYQRDPDRVKIPRAAFGVSFLNTCYWLWYSLDFIPAVNASPVEDLHIDPMIGYGALGLGIAINVMTALYPSLLVARLDYHEMENRVHLYRYKLPFVIQASTPTVYRLGEVKIDTSDADLKKILEEYNGDWSRFKGHLALKVNGRSLPLLMDVQNANEEVKNGGEDLLQIMVRPKAFLASRSPEKKKKTSTKIAGSKRRIK